MKKALIVGCGMIGHRVVNAMECNDTFKVKDIILVPYQEDKTKTIQELFKPEPIIFRARPEIPEINEQRSSNGDLKRCKKGIHNYSSILNEKESSGNYKVFKQECIHCKRVI